MENLSTSPQKRTYANIRSLSENFLREYHPKLSIPTPIEEIAELQLNIKLNTVINLKQKFDIDGFIHSNFKEITIDDYVFNTYEERTRFTIAHEIGHSILHKNIYNKFNIKTKEEYRKFQNSIPNEDQKWLEIQAHIFAGCVLVPTTVLKDQVKDYLNNSGSIQVDYSIPFLQHLPEKFKVSPAVILRRLQKEKLVTENLY